MRDDDIFFLLLGVTAVMVIAMLVVAFTFFAH